MFVIYKATNNINGKSYIGYTDNFKKRVHEHQIASKHYNFLLYKAIAKYGWDNFSWQIIYESWDKDHCKNTMEKYFIEEYRTYVGYNDCLGYNMTLGGEGNTGPKTKEHAKKISLAKQGKKRSIEERNNIASGRAKTWLLENKNGDTVKIVNLHKFCIINNLSAGAMSKVAAGKVSHHKGWITVKRI